MKWFWKVLSPGKTYVMMTAMVYVCFFAAIAWMYYTFVFESFEALIIANLFCVATLILASIAMAYWSLINALGFLHLQFPEDEITKKKIDELAEEINGEGFH